MIGWFSKNRLESCGKDVEAIKDIGLDWIYPPDGSEPIVIVPDEVFKIRK